MNGERARDGCFLPEFCRLQTLFAVVVIAQLLVFIMVLVQPPVVDRWTALSLHTLFVQWIALLSTLLLCLARPRLRHLPPLTVALAAWTLVILVTLLVGELARRGLGAGLAPDALPFHGRNLAVAGIATALSLHYFHLQHAWRIRLEAATRARIESLQARIRPHFLFNSLNTIAAMIRRQPQQAEQAVEDLAALFRASLSAGAGQVPLRDELLLAREYLRLESLRLGERLTVDWRADELPGDALLPQFTLQPLLENAVYHGIESQVDGGTVSLRGSRNGDSVVIEIRNPPAQGREAVAGSGMAQDNVRERLQLAFGKAASFTVTEDATGYGVILGFPYRTEPR